MAIARAHPDPVSVAIFAKAPIAGFAKTRLIPRLGEDGAANVQRRLIERTVRIAHEANTGPLSLWCSPNADHEVFRSLGEHFGLALHDQIGNDLGARMHHAFSELTKASAALLIGTDCAAIASQHLLTCANLLRAGSDGVIVPVEDGGYILIGLKRPAPALFADMPWGTADVMIETRARAMSAGLSLAELPPLWDIDRVEDYQRALACGYL